MRRVLAIARMSFTEAVRDRILYLILVFALAMIGSSAILVTLSVGGEGRIVKDLGLACITFFGLFIAVFIGIRLVSREVERRTVLLLLARPVGRGTFLAGKFFGLALTLLVNVGAMGLGLLCLTRILEGAWAPRLLLAVAFGYLELLILTAVSLLFAAFSTPTLSTAFTLLVFVIGRLSRDLLAFAAQFGSLSLHAAASAIYYALPNLSRFSLADAVANNLPLAWEGLALTVVYGVAYAAAVLAAAVAIFQRRDFQ
jgi:ABC-type transport system involved in multi-copper enzyme maturation permease subunit